MAQIPRPPKQGNVTTYTAKVAAGYARILAGEVDADFDTIFGAWNGGADTVNIRDGAITSAKLAADSVGPRELQDGGIVTTNLGDASVTTPKIADGAVTDPKIVSLGWGKVTGAPTTYPPSGTAGGDLSGTFPSPSIRDGAVTAAKLAPGAVGATQIAAESIGSAQILNGSVGTVELADAAVTLPKIVVGQGIATVGGQKRTDTVAHLGLNDEQLYLEYTWTSRGGFYLIVASLHVIFGYDVAAPPAGYVVNLRLDGTPGVATDGAIQNFQWFSEAATIPSGTVVNGPATLTVAFVGFALSAGVHRVKITGKPINRMVTIAHINSGWSYMVEFA